MLPDVLATIALIGPPRPHLLAWVQVLDRLEPWREHGSIVWRGLSGIYASNAVGAVSLYVGSGVTRADKVFAATELPVLLRNPNTDAMTQDLLAYYRRCIQSGRQAINLGLLAA